MGNEDERHDEDDEGDEEETSDREVIVGRTQFTRDDFVAAHRALPGRRVLVVYLILVIAWLGSSYLLDDDWGNEPWLPLVTFALVGLVLGIAVRRGMRSWADNAMADLAGDHDVLFRFDDDAFVTESSLRQARVRWEALHRALETKEAFLVYTSSNVIQIVPKRAFSESEIETLGRWLRERIPRRPKPRPFRNAVVRWAVLIFAFLVIWQFMNVGASP